MKNKATWLLVTTWLLAGQALAQEVVLDREGRRVVVYPDGTWKYFDGENQPSGQGKNAGTFSPHDEDLKANHQQFEQAKDLEKVLSLKLVQLRLEQVELEQELDSLQPSNGKATDERSSRLKARLRNIPDRRKQLETKYEKARERASFLEQIMYLPAAIHAKKLAEWDAQNGYGAPAIQPAKAAFPGKIYQVYDVAKDVALSPPPPPCQTMYEGRSLDGGIRRDLVPEVIFTHTDPALLSQFVKGDFIVGTGYLTGVSGGSYAFTLEVKISTRQAPKYFGAFKAGDFIEIQLLDGETVRLFNKTNDPGSWQEATQAYVYRGQFAIGKHEEKLLRGSELDLVRVRWSKVKEEFEVYELDFFIRQFKCIDQLRGS